MIRELGIDRCDETADDRVVQVLRHVDSANRFFAVFVDRRTNKFGFVGRIFGKPRRDGQAGAAFDFGVTWFHLNLESFIFSDVCDAVLIGYRRCVGQHPKNTDKQSGSTPAGHATGPQFTGGQRVGPTVFSRMIAGFADNARLQIAKRFSIGRFALANRGQQALVQAREFLFYLCRDRARVAIRKPATDPSNHNTDDRDPSEGHRCVPAIDLATASRLDRAERQKSDHDRDHCDEPP